jgi:O-antigen ligase
MNVVVFTGSRTGYVAVFILAAYGIYRSKRRVLGLALFAVGLLVAAALVPSDYLERATSIVTMEEKEGKSAETRMEILEDAWTIFLENPLGIGVAAFPHVRMERFERTQDTHNLYLEVATNLGIQGLLAFGAFVITMFSLLRRTGRQLRDQQRDLLESASAGQRTIDYDRHLADVRFMGATATAVELFVVVRLALGLFGMDLYEIYWWFALGLTVALWRMSSVAAAKTHALLAGTALSASRIVG